MDIYEVAGEVNIFPQKGGWVYIRVPIEVTERLMHLAQRGLILIRATAGMTLRDTSLLPMAMAHTLFLLIQRSGKKKALRQVVT